MGTISDYNSARRRAEKLQSALREISMPWFSELEETKMTWEIFNRYFHGDALKISKEFSGLTQIPDYSSVFPKIEEEIAGGSSPLSEGVLTEEIESSANYSTNAYDINKVNQADLDYFRSRSEEVASAIAHTEFEDGMDNEITELVRSFINKNRSAAYNWLSELYSSNLKKTIIVEGLLRTLAMVTEKGDENILLPIVIAGLRSDISAEQEAAIMVIEEWRTKECLDALRTTRFASKWITIYANKVKKELEEELS